MRWSSARQYVPKKKFAFKNRSKVGNKDAAAAATPTSASESTPPAEATNQSSQAPEANSAPAVPSVPDCDAFRGEQGKTLVKERGTASTGDFALANLQDCTVSLLNDMSALWVSGLTNCKVLASPVAGAIFLDHCTNCTFIIASRQIRIHNSHDCSYYLHTASHPIIEHCKGMRFAPYNLSQQDTGDRFQEAQLNQQDNHWQEIDDFDWLRAQQSPNWSIIPVEERLEELRIAAWM